MGNSVSWLSGFLFSKKEIRILILGLVRDVIFCLSSKGIFDFPVVNFANRTMPERPHCSTD